MADGLAALYVQLNDLIDSLEDQGIIDSLTIHTFHLRDPMQKGPHDYIRLFPVLCRGSELALINMGRLLEHPTWNHNEFIMYYARIKLCAECMGASSLVHALGVFQLAFLAGVRDGCFSLLNRMRHECLHLRQQVENLKELVRRICFIELMRLGFFNDSENYISSDSDSDGDN